MKKKTLIILAAGVGSRFGEGIKQLTPVDDYNHLIIDYSIHDAISAGFNKIIFIIRKDIEYAFKEHIGNRIEEVCDSLNVSISYAFQEIDMLPILPTDIKCRCDNRKKPWGTGHAVLCASNEIDSPFAVINADDYYGKNSFKLAADFLDQSNYGVVCYSLKNTLSDNGGVTRGICYVKNNKLIGINETKNIIKTDNGATADKIDLDIDSLVSMNFWCYPVEFIDILKEGFSEFLNNTKDIEKAEYLLPNIADGMISKGQEFSILVTDDKWFGVTYKEDRSLVINSFRNLIKQGIYKQDLYSDLNRHNTGSYSSCL